jgi:hypothetical protein
MSVLIDQQNVPLGSIPPSPRSGHSTSIASGVGLALAADGTALPSSMDTSNDGYHHDAATDAKDEAKKKEERVNEILTSTYSRVTLKTIR